MFGFHMKLSNDSLNQVNYIKETLDNYHMNNINDLIVISYDIHDIYQYGSCFDSINIDKKVIAKSHSSSTRHGDGSGSGSSINHSISESSSNVEKLQQQLHSDNIDENAMNRDQISQLSSSSSSSCLQLKVLLQELKQLLTPFCNFMDNEVSMTEESLVNNIKIRNNHNNSFIHHQEKLFTLPNLYFVPKKKQRSNLCYLLNANNVTNTERSIIHSIFNGFLKSYRDIFPDDIQYSYIKSESIELMEIGLMLHSHLFLDFRFISDTSDKSSSSSSSSSSKYIRNDLIEYERRHMNNEHCTSSSSSSSITRIKTTNVAASTAAAVVVDSTNYDNSFCALLKHNQITIPIYDNNEYDHDQVSSSSSSLTTATTRSNTTVESIALLLLFIIKSRLLLLMIGMIMTFCIIYFFRFIYYRCKCRFLKVT
jgi:hypothetical protein